MPTQAVAVNRKAYHDYHVLESLEVGIALMGTEVKSLRKGDVNLRDAYARVENGEVWLHNAHIARYDAGNRFNHDPLRPRKLLLHRKQINELNRRLQEGGTTLVPLRLYFKDSHRVKLELGLVRGKKQYDKREAIAKRDVEREIARAVRRDVVPTRR